MSFVHTSVNKVSAIYLQNERRYNYTTPKSFLEQISLYSKLLIEKSHDLEAMILRLTDGLVKLESCAIQVTSGLSRVRSNIYHKNDRTYSSQVNVLYCKFNVNTFSKLFFRKIGRQIKDYFNGSRDRIKEKK